MKRLYPLILLPALSLALFLVELFRRRGYESVSGPVWLTVATLIVATVVAAWVGYSRFLQRFARLSLEEALLLDLLTYLPFLLLVACVLPASRSPQTAGTSLLSAALALSVALKVGLLLHYRGSGLQAAWSHPFLVPAAVIGLALLLRVSLIAANRFHSDEALYSHWGLLIASGKDVFLKTEIVDKPPVMPYTLALFFKAFGPSETAARLPNLIASLASIGILYGIARQVFDRRVAVLSALFLALSPFDIQYAPTAFTDPLMVSLALASGLLALGRRYLGAGLAMGLAAMTKPTALFFLPLLLLLAAVGWSKGEQERPRRVAALRLGAGFALVTFLALCWDVIMRAGSARVADAGLVHYGGLRLVSAAAVMPRLQGWLTQLQYVTGSQLLNALLVAGVPALLAFGLWRRRARPGWFVDWALAGFALYFVALHTLLSFNIWDRYLLGLVPIVALLLSRVVLLPYDALLHLPNLARTRAVFGSLLGLFLVVALLPPAQVALRYGLPVGGDHGLFQGIEDVAAYFKGTVPAGSVVFHRWLGWHYSFYMFDLPFGFYYYPSPEYLLDLARRLPAVEKYVVFPSWASAAEMEACLRAGGWELREMYRTFRPDGAVSFTIYRIQPLAGKVSAPGPRSQQSARAGSRAG